MYKYNIHTHTSEVSPCGMMTAEETVLEHIKTGFQGIIITDHFWPGYVNPRRGMSWQETCDFFKQGYLAAKEAGDKHGLDVFYGMELRFEENSNDYLVFGLPDEFVLAHENMTDMSLADFRKLTKADSADANQATSGGLDVLIIQAHPFRDWMTRMPPELLDGVEVFNANSRHDNRNASSYAFACEHDLIGTSGSDYHQLDDIDRGGILTNHKIADLADFIATLRARDFKNITF
ncbi:MAG: PHP domain-containing protein [Bacillota bacterium]